MGAEPVGPCAGISRTALYQIEKGHTSRPRAATVRKISRALGVSPAILLGTTFLSDDDASLHHEDLQPGARASLVFPGRDRSSQRVEELVIRFRMLLGSPVADGVARIVEDLLRLFPNSSADLMMLMRHRTAPDVSRSKRT